MSNTIAERPPRNARRRMLTGAACALAGALLFGAQPQRAQAKSIAFSLVPSPGAAKCLPYAYGHATLSNGGVAGANDDLHLVIGGLPPYTGFDVFTLQVPNFPFGMSAFQGFMETNKYGTGTADFIGVYDVRTFMVAPGVAPAPVVYTAPISDASTNPKSGPVHTYHLGLWFDSPAAAGKAGCATALTPFNGPHTAGIQALNTGTFGTLAGPLRYFTP